jgi:hypothetical protein
MNVFLMLAGGVGTLTFVVGMVTVNRVNSGGVGVKLGDLPSFLFYAALTSFYVGLVLSEKAAAFNIDFDSPISADILAAWSVGFSFSVMLERFALSKKSPDSHVVEDTTMTDFPPANLDRFYRIRKALSWVTSTTRM